MNKRRFMGWFCLLIYLLAWVGSAQAMPLLLASVGHAHKIFLTYHGDKIQIALHHPGYIDEHEPTAKTPLAAYQHDFLDKTLLALSNRAAHDYSDHIIHLPLDQQTTITASKKSENNKTKLSPTFPFLATAPPFPALAELMHPLYLSQPPPDNILLIPLHIRTTVLLN
ncbi:hypothetical protein [Nitrosococcus oceani]|uniref:Uncharacterized protein n=2 Tax=Nitrosococcus oceani TaxID=1229 RepID=Q3JB86_NITOC|nr:hypothetical protein [Nitrosococcus oceani]KFI19638.1 hypothetical protein IB75_07435 [Nitrosococcus oceani C-27]ABA57910.1 hypothetical protein Noc_1421 [Nitrosococcus oceani ATCC 19707]EDZ68522.1 hypothetical protein NOC27_1849 [Nitrosococcus oceani AFC27]KFI22502.1 hypothetical protein HW44_09370 [Nitrosococcus oceani]GEM19553.1 hypothetical protein NONS58_09450 [Nitrosococcus oceani]